MTMKTSNKIAFFVAAVFAFAGLSARARPSKNPRKQTLLSRIKDLGARQLDRAFMLGSPAAVHVAVPAHPAMTMMPPHFLDLS